MNSQYSIADTSNVITPGLIFYPEIIAENIQKMVRIAGSPSRLRPHCKTHKMKEVIALELGAGITRHKCATLAEAEMLAECGVRDILLAYNVVGANIGRVVAFVTKYPDVTFAATADHARPIEQLGSAMQQAGKSVDLLLDVDPGRHRTGIAPGEAAVRLYKQIAETPGLRAAGLHVYDGHQHQESFAERSAAVGKEWEKIVTLCDDLAAEGLEVEKIVSGGTPTFPVYAAMEDPRIECSPGTCVINDCGYGTKFSDLDFTPAALLLTRVISRPTDEFITLDLGYKAIASDKPMESRAEFPQIPDAELVLQNEEHLVIRSKDAANYSPGDELFAIPRHICPTSALHKQVYVVERGEITQMWDVAARDRWLTV